MCKQGNKGGCRRPQEGDERAESHATPKALPPTKLSAPCPSRACPSRASSRHLVRRVDLGLVLDQQPHHRLVTALGSQHEARLPVLPGRGEVAGDEGGPERERGGGAGGASSMEGVSGLPWRTTGGPRWRPRGGREELGRMLRGGNAEADRDAAAALV